ncbi:type III secretion system needle complex protein [Escherichia coli]|uniref:type III secretion system needle complex protein n=1 Tax=Escherichia coli TaxID=562 RepID=UPI00058A490B|nr:type III secretion system needle complex protein [Escherichia coli]EAC1403647.1 type III secretion system needle complex protein [Escherichia coli]EEW6031447.1 type III secretion system needle complex protein [Escherichia coli]EFC4872284.1 type III secretion system needle complex protein [Escherichia coli]EFN9260371.1 type III secretion system needle complex protein [Escherichia coli]EGK3604199.1 type III secretion system needle complex protein [Escherichia coli]
MAEYVGYIDNISQTFDREVINLQDQVEQALKNLSENPSDPSLLATYQSKLYEYQLYRTAQSNTIKAFKDLDASVIQNYR